MLSFFQMLVSKVRVYSHHLGATTFTGFGGCWSEEDAEKHINTLETKAVWIGEIYTLDNASNMHVRLDG